ncbi:MAG: ferric reductase-like transmembrane domain-containing protein [Desulfococcaceae bacterium]
MGKGLLWIGAYALAILSPPAMALIFGDGGGDKGLIYEAGRAAALVGLVILSLQVFLTGRFKPVEREFGLDILVRFHRWMAVFATALLLLHPLLLAVGGAGWGLLFRLDLPWYIWAGKLALVLLAANVLVSLYQRRFGLSFERWRLLHNVLVPAILVLGFVHSWIAGHDLSHAPLRQLWPLLGAISLAALAYHRRVRPRRLDQKRYRVVDVVSEAPDVRTIMLAPPKKERVFRYAPGQFAFFTFHRADDAPVEEHHWTLSSSPAEKGYVTITVKSLGDYTATMDGIQKGDTAAVHGPFGRFSHQFHPDERELVFIAGGIGATPPRSMIRHLRDTQDARRVTFLYGNSDEENIVFADELRKIAAGKHPRLKVHHVLENPPDGWDGERGVIDREKIQRLCGGQLKDRKAGFYVCGPPGLTESVVDTLKELGVPDGRIHLEVFSFLD